MEFKHRKRERKKQKMDKHKTTTRSTGRLIMIPGLIKLLLLLAMSPVAQCGKCYPLLLFAFDKNSRRLNYFIKSHWATAFSLLSPSNNVVRELAINLFELSIRASVQSVDRGKDLLSVAHNRIFIT